MAAQHPFPEVFGKPLNLINKVLEQHFLEISEQKMSESCIFDTHWYILTCGEITDLWTTCTHCTWLNPVDVGVVLFLPVLKIQKHKMSNRHPTCCMCPTLFLVQYNTWHCCTTKWSQCILHTFCMTQKNATKNQCFFKKKERDYMVDFPNRKQLILTLSFFRTTANKDRTTAQKHSTTFWRSLVPEEG